MEKKLEDEDSDYDPNLFEAKDSDDEVDVSNRKPPPETIAVQENNRVSHSSNTGTDGMENFSPPCKSVAVPNLNTNDHRDNLVPSSTVLFVAIIICLILEELVSVFILSFNIFLFCLVSSIYSLFIALPCTKLTLITISRMTKATNFALVN
jgi:hypothetical protein